MKIIVWHHLSGAECYGHHLIRSRLLLAWTWKRFSYLIVLGFWVLEGLKKLSWEMNKQTQVLPPTRKVRQKEISSNEWRRNGERVAPSLYDGKSSPSQDLNRAQHWEKRFNFQICWGECWDEHINYLDIEAFSPKINTTNTSHLYCLFVFAVFQVTNQISTFVGGFIQLFTCIVFI